MTPTEQDNELREAIRKDFHQLLVKEFTADWKIQRIVRDLEIDVISLDNTMQLITADRKRVALEARLDELEHTFVSHDNALASELVENPEWEYGQVAERIAELKAQQEEV